MVMLTPLSSRELAFRERQRQQAVPLPIPSQKPKKDRSIAPFVGWSVIRSLDEQAYTSIMHYVGTAIAPDPTLRPAIGLLMVNLFSQTPGGYCATGEYQQADRRYARSQMMGFAESMSVLEVLVDQNPDNPARRFWKKTRSPERLGRWGRKDVYRITGLDIAPSYPQSFDLMIFDRIGEQFLNKQTVEDIAERLAPTYASRASELIPLLAGIDESDAVHAIRAAGGITALEKIEGAPPSQVRGALQAFIDNHNDLPSAAKDYLQCATQLVSIMEALEAEVQRTFNSLPTERRSSPGSNPISPPTAS
jgi:hypothetical protein